MKRFLIRNRDLTHNFLTTNQAKEANSKLYIGSRIRIRSKLILSLVVLVMIAVTGVVVLADPLSRLLTAPAAASPITEFPIPPPTAAL